jgi:hypothetical protein
MSIEQLAFGSIAILPKASQNKRMTYQLLYIAYRVVTPDDAYSKHVEDNY